MASERERLSTIKIVVFYIIVSVTFLFGQAVPTPACREVLSSESTVFIRLNAAAFIKFFVIRVRRLFEGGV